MSDFVPSCIFESDTCGMSGSHVQNISIMCLAGQIRVKSHSSELVLCY